MGNTQCENPAQLWGAPKVEDDLKIWGISATCWSGGTQLYAHANYASERVTGGFFFRNPNTRAGVFSIDGGETLLMRGVRWTPRTAWPTARRDVRGSG